jgi:hypothetical protein
VAQAQLDKKNQMAHKKEFVATGNGFYVKNGSTKTQVISQAGAIIGDIQATAGSIGTAELADDAVTPAKLDHTVLQYSEIAITSANITATTAGALGHADGVVLVAGQTGKIIELISATLIYDYAGAGYATGGNITINQTGGSAVTGVVSAANSLGATSDKVVVFAPLAATATPYTKDLGLNLVAATAFTNGGSATGVVRVKVAYRVHTHGLA